MNQLLTLLLGSYLAGIGFTFFDAKDALEFHGRTPWSRWLAAALAMAWPVSFAITCWLMVRPAIRRMRK